MTMTTKMLLASMALLFFAGIANAEEKSAHYKWRADIIVDGKPTTMDLGRPYNLGKGWECSWSFNHKHEDTAQISCRNAKTFRTDITTLRCETTFQSSGSAWSHLNGKTISIGCMLATTKQ